MSSNEANELKTILDTLCGMIDTLLVLVKEFPCNQSIVRQFKGLVQYVEYDVHFHASLQMDNMDVSVRI